MSHHRPQERPTCRGCRILRVELARLHRESEARAAADAQRCLAMYDHMERLARLNIALTQQRKTTTTPSSHAPVEKHQALTEARELVRADELCVERDERVQRLQATIVEQAREVERLERQQKISVPMLQLDGANVVNRSGEDTSEDDDSDNNQGTETEKEEERARRRRRGLEKMPLTSLHAQLRARDATIHRLEHYVDELTQALATSRDKKSHAATQYQHVTKAQQSQLRKCAARIEEQSRTQRESEREVEGLKAYVSVLEKKLLQKRLPAERTRLIQVDGVDGRHGVRVLDPRDPRDLRNF